MARILIVTDDAALAAFCADALAARGHEVRRAPPASAAEDARARQPELILVDGADPAALTAVAAIEARRPTVPLFVLLNRGELPDVLDAMQVVAP